MGETYLQFKAYVPRRQVSMDPKKISTLLLFIFAPIFAAAEVKYTVLNLGTLGGDKTFVGGINNLGQVVGASYPLGSQVSHAFRTAPNSPINIGDDLGTLGGGSGAASINDLGQVGGTSRLADNQVRAFLTTPGGTINPASNLGVFPGAAAVGSESLVYGINNSGIAVGQSAFDPSGERRGFIASPGTTIANSIAITSPSTRSSSAYGISANGQVTGTAYTTTFVGGQGHAFRLPANSDGILSAATDLGALGTRIGGQSEGLAINDNGQVVGYSHVDTYPYPWHAFRTAPNGTILPSSDLGTLSTLTGSYSRAFAINNAGQVVGSADTDTSQHSHAFFADANSSMVDLNYLIDPSYVIDAINGIEQVEARGINDSGQIIVNGWYYGQNRAFLLTPIPEPSSLFFVSAIFGSLLLRRKNRSI